MSKKNKPDESKMITKTMVKERGWSDRMIDIYLPPPKEFRNPRYKRAAPMKKWEESVVIEAEKSAEFQADMVKKNKRSKAMIKVHDQKRIEILEFVQNLAIQVTPMKPEELREETLSEQQDLYDRKYNCWCDARYDVLLYAKDADETTIRQWEVDFIRHTQIDFKEYMAYVEQMRELFGNPEKYKAHLLLKTKIYSKIAEVYPDLAGECERRVAKQIEDEVPSPIKDDPNNETNRIHNFLIQMREKYNLRKKIKTRKNPSSLREEKKVPQKYKKAWVPQTTLGGLLRKKRYKMGKILIRLGLKDTITKLPTEYAIQNEFAKITQNQKGKTRSKWNYEKCYQLIYQPKNYEKK